MSLTKESVVVITGAASGIGRALAAQFSREPIAGLALCDIDAGGLTETESLAGAADKLVTLHRVDVSSEGEMRAFAEEVFKRHGRVTHLINNAGVALGGLVKEVSLSDIRWLIEINFWGTVYGTKLFLPYMEKEKSAHIVNFSSIFGIVAPPGQAAYSASKFAIRGFTESLRHEVAGTNIAVSIVHPGGVKTNIANSARIGEFVPLTEKELRQRKDRINRNLSRTSPEEAAEIVVAGVKARKSRIIVGADARILGLFARLFPENYFSVVNFVSGGRFLDT